MDGIWRQETRCSIAGRPSVDAVAMLKLLVQDFIRKVNDDMLAGERLVNV